MLRYKVIAATSLHYWFTGMHQYVKTCIRCYFACLIAKGQSGKIPGYLQPIPLADIPFCTVHVDYLLVTLTKGYNHILIFVDLCTRYIELYTTVSISTTEVIDRFSLYIL